MSDTTEGEGKGRAGIIEAVKKPISFFALALLVGEAGLLAFAIDATGINQTVGIVGMILMLLFSAAAVYFLARKPGGHDADFMARIEGRWWERVNFHGGTVLSTVRIERERYSGQLILKGAGFGPDGKPTANWSSQMTRVYPEEQKATYLWKGDKRSQAQFHGFGTITFSTGTDSERFDCGNGHFWDVDESKPENTVYKAIELRRILDSEDLRILDSRSASDTAALVVRVLENW